MKLTVVYANCWAAYVRMDTVGATTRPTFRRVTIELTDEQSRALERRVVGSNGGEEVREDTAEIFLEESEVE